MTNTSVYAWRTFDALLDADLDQVYQLSKDEMLRSRAFQILLAHAKTIPDLEHLAFDGPHGCARWSTRELMDMSNRFRMFSSPENEIRLYRECQNGAFRQAQRVREFFVLALNKSGRPAEAIHEAAQIIAEGGQNALVWGALGDAHTARMLLAEKLASVLAPDAVTTPARDALDPGLIDAFRSHFPEVALVKLTGALASELRGRALKSAMDAFQHGFRDSGEPYPGLGWMARTIDHLCDLVHERHVLGTVASTELTDTSLARLQSLDIDIATLRHELDCQGQLIAVALSLQGGHESRDYWTHASQLQLAVMAGVGAGDLDAITGRAIATADADFKFHTLIDALQCLRGRLVTMHQFERADERETSALDAQLARTDGAISALEAGRKRFLAADRTTAASAATPVASPPSAMDAFLSRTVNFRALISNLIPLTIEGTIGRVGARVPDLLINRRVQAGLLDIIESEVLPELTPEERADPRAVIQRIQQIVGAGLNLSALQDLQSPAHTAFDTRSDGLIALSGVDLDLRKDTQTGTDLTAALLMQTGDCRETMYLNGALFACWQLQQVRRCITRALSCLAVNYAPGFRHIVHEEIPALMRYQLRGGQVDVFVESIAVESRYHTVRRTKADPRALERRYGLDELRAGQGLSHYELEQSIIEVTYADGTIRRFDHVPASDAGVPVIENAGEGCRNLRAVRLLNMVESHALTFLLDERTGQVDLCDGFYHERLFDSPYAFSAGAFDINELSSPYGLVRANSRSVISSDGALVARTVYLRFLRYSHTDYATGLVEGDIPDTLQLMGRAFNASFRRERRRMDRGQSPVPALLQRIESWQKDRATLVSAERPTLDRQIARLMLDLAKEHPELLHLRDVSAGDVLIREGCENQHVYLVLSGHLTVCHSGQSVVGTDGRPIVITGGNVVGEISALRNIPATATVQGDASVLSLTVADLRAQLASHPILERSLSEIASFRTQRR